MPARCRLPALVVGALALGLGAAPAVAASGEPSLHPARAKRIWVDAAHGRDGATGSKAHPLRTVRAAWERIPQAAALKRAVIITLRPGRWTAQETPNYWESRWGTAKAPVIIRAQRRGTATLPAVNMFDARWTAFDGVRFADHFELLHCERCQHLLLARNHFDGSQAEQHENVKINQAQWVFLRGNRISGADDNSVDFVAVQHGEVSGNDISHSGDWCMYTKGGSAHLKITGNAFHDCGTGGFTAGQGTGFQFMTAPFLRYEAYGIVVSRNSVWDTAGAAFGVNGGLNVAIVNNRAWNVGRRSHLLEVVYGLRSCDGQPGDHGRGTCQANLDAGGWGTTRVDDGTNAVRIPNRNVTIAGNVIGGPARTDGQLLSIAGPFSGSAQRGSGLGAVRADTGLRVFGNRFVVGRNLADGTDDCRASDCRRLRTVNTVQAAGDPFRTPHGTALRTRTPWPAARLPRFSWAGQPSGVARRSRALIHAW
jgi:Right handed beta helix region